MNHIPSDGPSSSRGLDAQIDTDMDAYIDGRMEPAERAAYEERVNREPALRAEVDMHRQLEATLRTSYGEAAATPQTGAADVAATPTRRSGRWWMGVAAAIVLLVIGWQWVLPAMTRVPGPEEKLVAEYAAQVSAGFVPKEVCTTDEAFVAWTVSTYGIGISPAALPASVQLLGWTRRDTLSSYTGVLLAKVDGREVVVFMDPSGSTAGEPGSAANTRTGLRVFSQRIGGLTLYEVTPRDRPAVLPGLSQVEVAR